MKRYTLSEPEWAKEYFTVCSTITFDLDVEFTREKWNGRIKACRGIDASLSKNEIESFEKEHLEMLRQFPEKFTIPHFASILDLKNKDR